MASEATVHVFELVLAPPSYFRSFTSWAGQHYITSSFEFDHVGKCLCAFGKPNKQDYSVLVVGYDARYFKRIFTRKNAGGHSAFDLGQMQFARLLKPDDSALFRVVPLPIKHHDEGESPALLPSQISPELVLVPAELDTCGVIVRAMAEDVGERTKLPDEGVQNVFIPSSNSDVGEGPLNDYGGNTAFEATNNSVLDDRVTVGHVGAIRGSDWLEFTPDINLTPDINFTPNINFTPDIIFTPDIEADLIREGQGSLIGIFPSVERFALISAPTLSNTDTGRHLPCRESEGGFSIDYFGTDPAPQFFSSDCKNVNIEPIISLCDDVTVVDLVTSKSGACPQSRTCYTTPADRKTEVILYAGDMLNSFYLHQEVDEDDDDDAMFQSLE